MWREVMAVMTPFLSSATRVSRKVRSLPWALEVMCSERVSTHLTGRPPAFLRSQGADRHLRIAGDLDAEAATDIGGLDANAVDVNLQMRGQKLDGKRRKGIVALVVDALVFRRSTVR